MLRVLIVDDDKLARKGLISLLPWEHYQMEVVGDVQNGRAALEFLEREKVDLAFVDIDMPEMSGLELIEACKPRYPELKFVILTFYEDFGYAQNAIRLGVLDYISKLKLDSEDGDSILERISTRIKKSNERYGMETGEVDPEKWNELTHEWEQGYWLYDEEEFGRLCQKSEELGSIFHAMRHFSSWLTQSLEISLGRKPADRRRQEQVSQIENIRRLWDWLSEWRKEMYRFAEEETKLSSMPVCMLKTVQYIRAHISESLHTEELAERVGMSRSYFSVNFKKLTGSTFHEYVKRERMKEAKRLLGEEGLGMMEVAARSGYEDVNYFNKVFVEEEGCSPGVYRKQRKEALYTLGKKENQI